jgi:hypothetical protein
MATVRISPVLRPSLGGVKEVDADVILPAMAGG